MSKKNPLKSVTEILGVAFLFLFTFSSVTNAETSAGTNPFTLNDLTESYLVAEGKCGEGKCGDSAKAEGKCGNSAKAEGKCGEGKCGDNAKAEGKCGEGKCGDNAKAEGKCGEGKCGGKGVDMQGNVVELGNFRYGGDDMAKYAGGKLATGVKDPAVCGTFSAAKCSVGHLSK